jgi:hypothetical protein
VGIAVALSGPAWLHGQDAASNAPTVRAVGLTPRLTPADYQFHVQAGPVTVAAEFVGHDIPTEEGGPYATEAYVVVLAAVFGPTDKKFQLTNQDFSLRINGAKKPVPSQPYVIVFPTLKDPDWEPLNSQKEQAALNAGGGRAGQPEFRPAPPKMPIERRHLMEQRVLKASLPEGERTLPQAGLLYFEWHTDTKNIRSLELVVNGAEGKATLALAKP